MPCFSPALLPIRSNNAIFTHMRCMRWQNWPVNQMVVILICSARNRRRDVS
jgi:hypothetical protein